MEAEYVNKPEAGASPRAFCPPGLDMDQMESLVENFAKEDSFESKTITRIIVERYLSKVCNQRNESILCRVLSAHTFSLDPLVQSSTKLQKCSFLEQGIRLL